MAIRTQARAGRGAGARAGGGPARTWPGCLGRARVVQHGVGQRGCSGQHEDESGADGHLDAGRMLATRLPARSRRLARSRRPLASPRRTLGACVRAAVPARTASGGLGGPVACAAPDGAYSAGWIAGAAGCTGADSVAEAGGAVAAGACVGALPIGGSGRIRRRPRLGHGGKGVASVRWCIRATAWPCGSRPRPRCPAVANRLPRLGRGHVRGRIADRQHRVAGLGIGGKVLVVVPR